MRESVSQVDLLVIGGGMAGLSAAAYAARNGAGVVLVEKGPAVGGSAAYARYIHTAPTVDVMREVNPGADPKLASRLVKGYDGAIEWVRSLGVHMDELVPLIGYSRGRRTDMPNYLLACEGLVIEHGELLVSSTVERLLLEDGAVVGAAVRTAGGEERVIRARSTLMASGGFGGDPELRAKLIHPLAGDLPLRANVYSTGDGLRLGETAGAAFGPPDAGFYGHLIPSGIAYDPDEFRALSFYHSEHSILVNLDGRRFCDETIGDHLNTLDVLDQPEARALLIGDQRVRDEWMLTPYVKGGEPLDRFQLARERGARAVLAEDIDELEALPEQWGYPRGAVRDTVREFNEQCRTGKHSPGRKRDAAPLVDPPYYVIEVIPAITHPYGGIRIDERARALDADGTPIPGLFAAGADAGGVFYRAYAGGLASALVFGLEAARTAITDRGVVS
jgi:succinate dehydrogenase/fumarate reductase flavoprotein subunit